MDTKRLLIVAAVGLGAYMLLMRRGAATVATSATPAATVTAGYTAPAVVGGAVATFAHSVADTIGYSTQAQGPQGDGP